MADNLLDKASILLTPTAYNDGRMLSVKPNENLYGSELVTNGDFATNSDWTVGSSWTISGGSANCDGGTSNLDQASIVTNTKYKVTVTVSNITTGTLAVRLGGSNVDVLSLTENGTYTGYGLSNSDVFRLRSQSGFDGSVDNVSVVEDLSGDFTFSRGSAATRVNAQGLVENVQIISPELVSNGNFSQIGTEEVLNGNFSQEGSELITNGDFATDSDWNGVGTGGVTILGGKLNFDNSPYAKQIIQTNVTTIGKTFKVTYTISDYVDGIMRVSLGSNSGTTRNANGTYTDYITADVNTAITFVTLGGVGTTLSIDNVSVKEVAQNWDLDTGWSIGDDKVEADGTSAFLIQSNFQSVASVKSYKIQYEVLSTNGVNIRFGGGSSMFGTPTLDTTTIGVKTIYLQSNGTVRNLQFQNNLGFIGSITNISVKEVGQDWTFGTDVVVGDSVVKMNNSAALQGATQTNVITSGNLCKVSFEVKNYVNGIVNLRHPLNENVSANGVYNFVGNANDTKVFIRGADTANNFEITNISVKEITDDTDIPRINYSGFSYQDSLGSELVVNGDFSNGTNDWSFTNPWSVSNKKAFYNSSTLDFIRHFNVFNGVIGTTYKITFDIYDTVGVRFQFKNGNSSLFSQIFQNGSYTFTVTTQSADTDLRIYGFVSSSGSIDNVSVKEYLGQEVVPDSGCGSWLLEPQSTNLLPYSEDFSFWATGTGGVSIETGYLAPDGSSNATKVTMDSGFSNTALTFYASLGTTESRTIYARTVSGTGKAHLCSFNGNASSLFDVTEQWQRFEVNGDNSAGAVNFYAIDFRGSTDLSEIIVWGAQAENLSYATSYIPTNGAASTRLKDIATNSGNSSLINSTEGVLYAEIAANENEGSFRQLTISDGSGSNRVSIDFTSTDNQIRSFSSSGGSTAANMSASVSNAAQFNKVAVKYKLNDYALWINGVEVATDTSASTPLGLSELAFDNGAGANDFYGKVKAVAVYKEALTDAEIQSLTTI